MKILVVGGGGREHALVWKLSQSRHISQIYCCPGNSGIAEIAECINLSPNDFSTLIDFVKYEWIDLTIIGAEGLPLGNIMHSFEREGCNILGPNKTAAEIISSRVFAKHLMRLHKIPTADFKVFTSYLHAVDHVRLKGAPIVIKIDRHLHDDSVFVALTVDEAIHTLKLIMKDRVFEDAGKQVILEEKLKGDRVSFVVLTDGKTVKPLTSLSLYTDSSHGDIGSRTLLTGAYGPAISFTAEREKVVMEKIIHPVVKALNAQGTPFKGIVSADLIIDEHRAYLFDLNCYFGDLEAQTILPRLNTDLVDVLLAITGERLSDIGLEWQQNFSLCIAMSGEGSPEQYQQGAMKTGLEQIKALEDTFIFHENTSFSNTAAATAPERRVLSIVTAGASIQDSRTKAYRAAEKVHVDGMHYRKDIGDI